MEVVYNHCTPQGTLMAMAEKVGISKIQVCEAVQAVGTDKERVIEYLVKDVTRKLRSLHAGYSHLRNLQPNLFVGGPGHRA